ncbi:cytochrome P450 monooxygenase [Melampsora larici-populina 98AG31]|uniref:Cytochrome P450 monooxygenase n=1 Tax=Melampsora larici-populina (strain 98AG31 / pathotype 3-4-7) TaxID=747676 RepID=F4RTC0_MELLP|nr:cytochrome P450 monooxygenase [Melampsora larici-populina 98AG31]EGG04372.1 cytochrome P450 monooxygenase [Melampsora larici-populina 98AG31]
MSEYLHLIKELAFFLIALRVVSYIFKYRKRAVGTSERKDVYHDLPGWPLIGQLPEVILNRRCIIEWGARITRVYGAGAALTLPGTRLIQISRPEWIEYVQKTNFSNYVKGNLFQDVMSPVFGQGIFVTDGAAWKATRQTKTRIFNARNFKTIVTPAMHETLRSFNGFLDLKVREGAIVKMDDVFHRFTLESFVKMMFGREIGALSVLKAENEADPFVNAFDYVQRQLDIGMVLGAFSTKLAKILARLPKMKAARQIIDSYAYDLIDARLNAGPQIESPADLLGLFMQSNDEKGFSLSRDELKDAAINFIIAGSSATSYSSRDTTAQALSWTLFHLIQRPALVASMRVEIEGILPEDDALVDYENYKQFINVLSVFYEGLRLHPSVPKAKTPFYRSLVNLRFAVDHDKLPDGPIVQPNDYLYWSDWQMARDPSIWGDDCAEFKPSRWIDEAGKLKQYSQWKFHAFNGGPRICLGMHLATLEAVAVIVEIVRRYDMAFAPGWLASVPKIAKITQESTEETPRYGSSLTLPMAQPMQVILTRRKVS